MTDRTDPFAAQFLTAAGADHYVRAITEAAGLVAGACAEPASPGLIDGASALRERLSALTIGARGGVGLPAALSEVTALVARNSTAVADPRYVAHLHCPPTIPSLAGEVVLTALNQSMDSFDQGPAAAVVERMVVEWLCATFHLDDGDGVFTSGGTQSNLQALTLARDHYAARHLGRHVATEGLPAEASRWRIVCTTDAHFTVATSAGLLGLGTDSLRYVDVDADGRMDVASLERVVRTCRDLDEPIVAIVVTAGTTNRGVVDPLRAAVAIAREHGIWIHVDAAAGGCLMLSDRNRHLLDGISDADSITVDFHKLLFQSISCGALLLRDGTDFDLASRHVDYLNPDDDDSAETINLVGRSLQTTRRFDALKVSITLRALGIDTVAAMIDATVASAHAAADAVTADSRLELLARCETNTVLLRWNRGDLSGAELDHVNAEVRRRLAADQRALLGRTRVDGALALKLTFVNPVCTPEMARSLVGVIADCGDALLPSVVPHP